MNRPVNSSATPPAAAESLWHIAFYQFVALPDPDAVAVRLRELTHALTGSILVAQEGINGVVAAPALALDAFEHALTHDRALNGYFASTVFKRSACKSAPFFRMKVHRKKEIVAFGADTVSPGSAASSVSPQAWRELIAQDDVVVIDNRNSFEYRLGKFKSAISCRHF